LAFPCIFSGPAGQAQARDGGDKKIEVAGMLLNIAAVE
jgi:hypothetical protein